MDKRREMFEAWAKSKYQNHSEMYFEWCDEYGHYAIDEVQFAFEAWEAASSASTHIGDINKMVNCQPVARIKTVGGYPDDSRHELELLVKHGQLFNGQLLYSAQPNQRAQWQPIETAPENEPFLGVLDCAGDRIICTMRYAVAKQKNSVPDNGDFHRERVTHRMPLPPEPTK